MIWDLYHWYKLGHKEMTWATAHPCDELLIGLGWDCVYVLLPQLRLENFLPLATAAGGTAKSADSQALNNTWLESQIPGSQTDILRHSLGE